MVAVAKAVPPSAPPGKVGTGTGVGSEDHFRLMFDSSPIGMALVATEGTWIDVNPAVCAITGYTREELLARDFQSITHPDDLDLDLEEVGRLLEGETDDYQLRKRYLKPDGTPVWVLLSVTMIRDDAGAPLYFLAQIVDIDRERRAESALAARDRLFRLTFEASPVGMLVGRTDGILAEVNQAFADLLGYRREDLVGHHYDEFTHPADVGLGDIHGPVVDADPDARVTFDKRFLRSDGTTVWAQLTMSSVTDAEGRKVRLVHVEDVSDRRQAQAAQEREQTLLRELVDLQRDIASHPDELTTLQTMVEHTLALIDSADGVVVELPEPGPDGTTLLRYSAVAGRLESQLGVTVNAESSLSGLVLRTRSVLGAEDTATDPRVDAEACRRTGIGSMLIAPLLAGDEAIGVLKVASGVPNAFSADDAQALTLLANSLTGALRHTRDRESIRLMLDEAERANQALAASEERFRLAFAHSPLGMVVLDLDGDSIVAARANDAITAITGLVTGDFEGPTLDWFADRVDKFEDLRQRFDELQPGGRDHLTQAVTFRRPDGRIVDLQLHVAVHPGADGTEGSESTARTLILLVEDVTVQHEIQVRLAERAQLLELASDAVIVRGLDDRISYWNPGAERIYGWPAAAVLGRDLDRLLGTTGGAAERQEIRRTLMAEGHWEGELEHQSATGRRVIVHSRKALQRDEQGEPIGILTINTDITARREAESALAASEQMFRSQFEHSAVGQCIRSLDDVLESVNPALARMMGYDSPAELEGRTGRQLAPPERMAERSAALAAIYAGDQDSVAYETTLHRKDGSMLDVHFTTSALRGPSGRPTRFVSIFQDISARKQAERARDQAAAALQARHDELERAERLKTDLIGMLGHEINTPLTVLLGATEIADEQWGDHAGPEEQEYLLLVRRNVERLTRTVTEVLDLVRAEAGRIVAAPAAVDIDEHLAEVLAAFDITAAITGDSGLSAQVQPGHLDQILANLISNALKYGGGPAEISVHQVEAGVEIAVIDHGSGVPGGFRGVLFDRFTREGDAASRADGTGLGLYIVRELALANQGDIRFTETPGGGSTFTVTLPV